MLIWGAVLASRQVRKGTGYPSSPEGLILVLLAACVAAVPISLPFAINPRVFVVVSLPLVVWTYLAVLQRRLTPPAQATERDRNVRPA